MFYLYVYNVTKSRRCSPPKKFLIGANNLHQRRVSKWGLLIDKRNYSERPMGLFLINKEQMPFSCSQLQQK